MAGTSEFLGRDIQHRRARAASFIALATYDQPDQHIVRVTTEYLGERRVWEPGLIMCVADAWIGGTTDVLVLEPWSGEPIPIAIPLSRVVSIEALKGEDLIT